MPNHDNTIRRLKEQADLIDCKDKPVKRTMIDFLQYYLCSIGLECPVGVVAEQWLEDYRQDLLNYEQDWVEPYRLRQLEIFQEESE